MAERPLGVSIIAILGFIGAIILILIGVFLMVVGGIGVSILGLFGFLGLMAGFFGAILIMIGLIEFVISYGLWKMKKWAWIIGIILNLVGVMASPISSIIGIIISGLILFYLWTKKNLFT